MNFVVTTFLVPISEFPKLEGKVTSQNGQVVEDYQNINFSTMILNQEDIQTKEGQQMKQATER